MSRREEIDAKRAKLAELRRLREEKRSASPNLNSETLTHARKTSQDREAIDQLVESLVGSRSRLGTYNDISEVSSPTRTSSNSDVPVTTNNESTQSEEVNSIGVPADHSGYIENSDYQPRDEPLPRTQVITYSKGVQTDDATNETSSTTDLKRDELEQKIRRELESSYNEKLLEVTKEKVEKSTPDQPQIKILEDMENVKTEHESLEHFLHQSINVIGRALEDDYDILVDYGTQANQERNQTGDLLISELVQFSSDETFARAVTGLDCSSKFPELVASSYTESGSDVNASKGLVYIWNLHVKSRPEYEFYGQSNILNVKFSPFHPNLVFGSAYNGQVLTWDMRSGSQPILKSSLTGNGHSHPVYTLKFSGTQNANILVSSSTDGTICTWTPDLLAKPQDRLVITNPSVTRYDEVSPTSLDISPRDTTRFLVGTEEGNIYQCNRFDQAGSRAGIDLRGVYKGHRAPITRIDFHTSNGKIDIGNYVLTSSLDWSVMLWKLRSFNTVTTTTTSVESENINPILEFRREDSVYDVAWNPKMPGVFADVEGSGYLEIWDLNKDIEIPQIRLKPSGNSSATKAYLNRPLNKLSWNEDGTRIAVGGLDGLVTVFDLDSSFVTPKTDEWSSLKRSLSQLGNDH